jgi:hypothetical protein
LAIILPSAKITSSSVIFKMHQWNYQWDCQLWILGRFISFATSSSSFSGIESIWRNMQLDSAKNKWGRNGHLDIYLGKFWIFS